MPRGNDPKLANTHTSIEAMGLAISDGKCYYASGAGPSGSCRSIWASLVSNNSGARAPEWYGWRQEFAFNEKGVTTQWKALPDSQYKHFVSLSPDKNIILLFDPQAAGASPGEIVTLRLKRMEEVFRRFFLWTRMHLDIPLLEDWIPFIWQDIQDNNPKVIQQMNVFGDCIGGWKISFDAGWDKYISEKLRTRQLTF